MFEWFTRRFLEPRGLIRAVGVRLFHFWVCFGFLTQPKGFLLTKVTLATGGSLCSWMEGNKTFWKCQRVSSVDLFQGAQASGGLWHVRTLVLRTIGDRR